MYFQIIGKGFHDFRAPSLCDLALQADDEHQDLRPHVYDSKQFPGEPLRLMERTVRLPGSNVAWRFMVAQARASLDQQIAVLRSTLIKSFAILGLGLIIMATLQTFYGLRPLSSVQLGRAHV